MSAQGVKVFAPASVANLAVGFDILGLAVSAPGDEIIAKRTNLPGIHIKKIHGDNGKLPLDVSKNTATYGALCLLKSLGLEKEVGVEMEVFKKMPFGSGLGSSAASAVAGVVACNELLGRPYSREALLPFAVKGESVADGAFHADNVAPSLLGGITLITDIDQFEVQRLPVPPGLSVVVIHPDVSILTRDARDVLKDTLPLSLHIRQSSLLAGFIAGLYTCNLELMHKSLKDVLIEPQRKALVPFFDEVKEVAQEADALGCSISGAGPSIFALSKNTHQADMISECMGAVFKNRGIPFDTYVSPVNKEGAIVY